jgi:hypothetical protein
VLSVYNVLASLRARISLLLRLADNIEPSLKNCALSVSQQIIKIRRFLSQLLTVARRNQRKLIFTEQRLRLD